MNGLRNVFLFSLGLLLFAACEEQDAAAPATQAPSVVPNVTPSTATTEQTRMAAINSADLQGTWQLTYIWYPERGWEPAQSTSSNFYNDTFLYSATGWNIESDTVDLFGMLPSGDRLPFISLPVQVEGQRLQIGTESDPVFNFNYTILLYEDQVLLVEAENDANIYHWFVKQ